MDFGIGETLAIISAVSAVAGATTGIVAGVQAHKQGVIQAQQADLQAQEAKTQAAVENQQRQKQLASILASQNAVFGSSNIDLGSGTPSVLANTSFQNAAIQTGQAKTFTDASVGILGLTKQDALTAGNYGMMSGFTGAASSLSSAASSALKAGQVPGSGGAASGAMVKGLTGSKSMIGPIYGPNGGM